MGRSRRRITIASMLAIICLLVVQTVDQALAGVVLPSGAGTLTIGPQAMEGNLQIHPGDTVKAGYDFTMPGAHAPAQVTVDNASITSSLQRYPFGSNDPLDFSDPSGDIPIPLVGAKIAAATCALFIAFSPATPAADAPIVQDCQQLISAAADLVTKRGALSQYYSQLAKNPNFARLLMAEEEAQADDDFLTGAMGLQDEVIALEG